MNDDRKRRTMEVLDVEDEESRQKRIQTVMEKMNTPTDNHQATAMPSQFDFGIRKTYAVEPPTDLLARVQSFLPQLEASNAILAQRAEKDPQSIDMEHIEDETAQYIEMDLGLGVFEGQKKKSGTDYDMSSSSSSSSDDDDADSTASDESDEIIMNSFLPDRPIKPLPRRASSKSATTDATVPQRPQIVVLASSSSGSEDDEEMSVQQ